MMESFVNHFRRIAKNETRSVTFFTAQRNLPPDQYVFMELYCTEPGCDCRNVVLNVVGRSQGHLATINHALDPDGFKDVGMPQTFLDPLNKQSHYSDALLKLFKEAVLDEFYAERLESHLQLMKKKFSAQSCKNSRG